MKKLSEQAQTLFNEMKLNGGKFYETDLIGLLFKKPIYPLENKTEEKIIEYWLYEANIYGNYKKDPIHIKSPIGGKLLIFTNVDKSYWEQTRLIFNELRDAGLVDTFNAGFNEFVYFVK